MAGTGTAHLRPAPETLLRVEDLVVEFPAGRQKVHAVSGVSLDIRRGEINHLLDHVVDHHGRGQADGVLKVITSICNFYAVRNEHIEHLAAEALLRADHLVTGGRHHRTQTKSA